MNNDAQQNLPDNGNLSEDEAAKEAAKRADHISDPSLNTEPGHDWTDEGGATTNGPALEAESDDDAGSR